MTDPCDALVVSPHADDEVLGCASVLGPDTFVLYLGVDDFHVVDRTARLAEIEAVSGYFGFAWRALGFPVNRYYTEHAEIVQAIERAVAETRPRRAFIPSPSYNQDHVTASRACRTALRRHDRNPFVPVVLGYEAPDAYLGDPGDAPPFRAAYFRALDVERKLAGYRLHASQVRAHRSEAILRGMAEHRGAQCGLPAAEAFDVIRWVDRAAGGSGA